MYTLSNLNFMGKSPKIDPDAFVAPRVFLAGDVRISRYASLWPGVVARGDVNYISIGECSNVQDLVCLHVADDFPCIIGDYVHIIDKQLFDRAGALVLENQVIPPNSLVVGVPGKVKSTINALKNIHAQALKYKSEWAIGYGVKPDIGGELYHGEKIV